MSKDRQKTPKRTTENPARGRKGRGARLNLGRLTRHRCGLCGKRRPDEWGKPPRRKYGLAGSPNEALHYMHPSCKANFDHFAGVEHGV